MSFGPGQVSQVDIGEQGQTLTTETVLGGNATTNYNNDTVALAQLDRIVGDRRQLVIPILEPTNFNTHDDLVAQFKKIECHLTYSDGAVYKFGDSAGGKLHGRGIVEPVFSPIDDKYKIHIDAEGVTDNPTTDADASWVDLEEFAEVNQASFNVTTTPGEMGLPLVNSVGLSHTVEIFDIAGTVESTLDTHLGSNTRSTVAIEHPDGSYLIYKHVYVHKQKTSPMTGGFRRIRLVLDTDPSQASKWQDAITLPSSPEAFLYGIQWTVTFFGYDESDFLTIA